MPPTLPSPGGASEPSSLMGLSLRLPQGSCLLSTDPEKSTLSFRAARKPWPLTCSLSGFLSAVGQALSRQLPQASQHRPAADSDRYGATGWISVLLYMPVTACQAPGHQALTQPIGAGESVQGLGGATPVLCTTLIPMSPPISSTRSPEKPGQGRTREVTLDVSCPMAGALSSL